MVALAFVAYLVVPILVGGQTGQSGQGVVEGFPTSVSARGDDGRERSLSVSAEDGEPVDLAQITAGDRLVVRGSGFDPSVGIYVAICKVPDSLTEKPGPCLGGVPELEEGSEAQPGAIEWAASNWINDDWAWKLFGARSFDDKELGTFTAYLLVPDSSDEFVDCSVDQCGVYTRNDHTALDDRRQDLYLPVGFSE